MIALSAVDVRALGHQGAGLRPADLAHPRRPDANRGAGLRQSMLGYAVEDLGRVRERAVIYKEHRLHRAEMVLPPRADERRTTGMKHNVGLVRTLREALGDDYDIMLDCWQSMNLDYCRRPLLADRRVPAALARRVRSCPTASTATSS